jgi:hypothetical protein|tara:strand:- start:829 stop:1095 length:267 start_codon:yes stop_codon:yes gene_type:complete
MDIFVALTVFAFTVGPGISSTPFYIGENKELCEQTAEEYNKVYKHLDYRKVVCLRMGTAYDPSIDSHEVILLENASNLNNDNFVKWSE